MALPTVGALKNTALGNYFVRAFSTATGKCTTMNIHAKKNANADYQLLNQSIFTLNFHPGAMFFE